MKNHTSDEKINENEYMPIRELSSVTGVNAVTLRAWERRYGLLKPFRTPKGHRLYSPTDVDVIKNVQRLLEQGIAISKVKNIIHQSTTVPIDESWTIHGEKLIAIINSLNTNKIETYLYELMGNYPPHILWEYLIQPLYNELIKTKDEYAMQSKLLFLANSLQKQSGHFIKSQSKAVSHSALIMGLDEKTMRLETNFIAMEMTGSGIKPILDFYLAPLNEVPFIVDNAKPDAIVLHGNGALTKQFVTREIVARLGKIGLPYLVTGNAAIINEALLSEQRIEHHADHQELIETLTNRLIGHE